MLNECLRMLSSGVVRADIRLYEPLSRWTTFRVGGSADALFIPRDEAELIKAIRAARDTNTPLTVIGNGSNLLVRDGGIRGLVLRIGPECEEALGNTQEPVCGTEPGADNIRLTVGAGVTLSQAARAAQRAGLAGMEAISGIPGSVGGAAWMNAGAYDREMSNIVESVRAIGRDGDALAFEGDALAFRYRGSAMMDAGVAITRVTFRLTEDDPRAIEERTAQYTAKRRAKQPLAAASAGSFFKRPAGHFAGKLIEDAGLKGLTVGGAQVSQMHAGFIINKGGASAADIIRLKDEVIARVFDKFGVRLEPEVRILGADA
ncbi:MAG: UDP-N-acetylmuramate dehydrogenase [Oscillospiraceae bacterium]|nr:UDP-N-acetylmuramate dehydrogenase [Oscillospiraceae bacterium]